MQNAISWSRHSHGGPELIAVSDAHMESAQDWICQHPVVDEGGAHRTLPTLC